MHIGNTDIFFHYRATYTGRNQRLEFMFEYKKILMSVVKDVDLEAMPTSIFLNDDDDDDIAIAAMEGDRMRSIKRCHF